MFLVVNEICFINLRCKGTNFFSNSHGFSNKNESFLHKTHMNVHYISFFFMIRVAVLASGSGSNAENVIRYFSNHPLIKISLILTNKSDAFVLQRARLLHVKSVVVSGKEKNCADLMLSVLHEHQIDWLVLAGFLLKIPESLIDAYSNRILNIHPSLLPKFGGKGMYGRHVHEAVVASNARESGITIHYVNKHYDEGRVVFQASCSVEPTDTAQDVAEKVHALEYNHYPSVIEQEVLKS